MKTPVLESLFNKAAGNEKCVQPILIFTKYLKRSRQKNKRRGLSLHQVYKEVFRRSISEHLGECEITVLVSRLL